MKRARLPAQHGGREPRHSPLACVTEFRVLGPVEARYGGALLRLGGAKQLTALAALLINHERLVSDSRLIHLLWGDSPPRTVNAQLYTYISRLRKRLSVTVGIHRVGAGYCLALENASLDYDQFRQLSDTGIFELNTAQYRSAADHLAEALRLWRGPALSGTTDILCNEQKVFLEQCRITVLESRMEADLALGRHAQVLAELHALSARYPMHEVFRGQLMRALCRCGRQGDAIKTYHDGRRLLATELGVDPDAKLQRTFQAIITGDECLSWPGSGAAPITRALECWPLADSSVNSVAGVVTVPLALRRRLHERRPP
jgi:SARP family transcriptional regulator, regulator of embCAB operon